MLPLLSQNASTPSAPISSFPSSVILSHSGSRHAFISIHFKKLSETLQWPSTLSLVLWISSQQNSLNSQSSCLHLPCSGSQCSTWFYTLSSYFYRLSQKFLVTSGSFLIFSSSLDFVQFSPKLSFSSYLLRLAEGTPWPPSSFSEPSCGHLSLTLLAAVLRVNRRACPCFNTPFRGFSPLPECKQGLCDLASACVTSLAQFCGPCLRLCSALPSVSVCSVLPALLLPLSMVPPSFFLFKFNSHSFIRSGLD